jgi:hypothetical protein
MTVKVVATGLGNQEPGGEGACCTAFDPSGPRLFFDVKHSGFPPDSTGRKVSSGHEYTHTWQESMGCISYYNHKLPNWMNEGIASIVPSTSLIRTGVFNDQVVRYQQYYGAKSTGEFSVPLELVDATNIWPGHVGYLAVEYLVSRSPSGLLSLRTVCESVAAGSTLDQAFQRAFGQSKDDLYRDFPTYLQNLKTSPIYLAQVGGRLPAGQVPDWMTSSGPAYKLDAVAYGMEDLSSDQQRTAWTYPPQACNWGSREAGKMYIAMCNAPSGRYPITLRMPDGRSSTIDLVHTAG